MCVCRLEIHVDTLRCSYPHSRSSILTDSQPPRSSRLWSTTLVPFVLLFPAALPAVALRQWTMMKLRRKSTEGLFMACNDGAGAEHPRSSITGHQHKCYLSNAVKNLKSVTERKKRWRINKDDGMATCLKSRLEVCRSTSPQS